MALFNYATKEITLKVVYYGPGLSGKTTNLQHLHASVLNPETTGKLLSLSTESDRTLFFDFLPVELGKIREFTIRFQLYTVPGQVRYNATRKVVLKGADAVVFVVDSQTEMKEQNIESFQNMLENLYSNNINPDDIPVLLQYNKRDLKNISSVQEINEYLNPYQHPVIEASAIKGDGVEESFKFITRLMLKYISKKHKIEIQEPSPQKKEETEKQAPVSMPEPAAEAVAFSKAAPAYEEELLEAIPSYAEPEEEAYEPLYELAEEELPDQIESPVEALPEEPVAPLPQTLRSSDAAAAETRGTETPAVPRVSTAVADAGVPQAVCFSPETVSAIAGEAGKIRESLAELRKIRTLVDELAQANGTLTDLKNAVYILSKEVKELKEIHRGQEETNSLLRSLVSVFEGLKTGRRWFRF
ncbi:MAG: ADP-ribosylation factor-like protein [Nitrospiraceae bacterium]|nr:ADP-ribosylation factor-like protein [Nitrospiraceae bacterium]